MTSRALSVYLSACWHKEAGRMLRGWHYSMFLFRKKAQEGFAAFWGIIAAWSRTSKYLVKKWEKKAPKYATMFVHKKTEEGEAAIDELSAGVGQRSSYSFQYELLHFFFLFSLLQP